MTSDNHEILNTERLHKREIRDSQPLSVDRFIKIYKGMVQKAIAMPNTAETIHHAIHDDQMINGNLNQIEILENCISRKNKISSFSLFMPDGISNHPEMDIISKKRKEISQLKTTRLTADHIKNGQPLYKHYTKNITSRIK
ncbi:MAG: hypothetical protein WCK26_01105 [Candidatus Saccharibacteria bacterium]